MLITYITLLRGINVGGNNIIKMSDLKTCFEDMGFTNVTTYIQSGNVIFQSIESNIDKLNNKIESILESTFNSPITVVTISSQHLTEIINQAPAKFGQQPDDFRYDVLFLKSPLSASDALSQIPINPHVDNVAKGPGVLYFSRQFSKLTQSKISKLVSLPIYKSITIRNWNTTTKLYTLAQAVTS